MSFVRKKVIEMDGASVAIAPLTCKQTDEFLAAQEQALTAEKPLNEKAKAVGEQWFKFIVDGMNNAGPEKEFTVESIQEQFDKVFLQRLKTEIAEMSGIAIKVGEIKAPSTSPS